MVTAAQRPVLVVKHFRVLMDVTKYVIKVDNFPLFGPVLSPPVLKLEVSRSSSLTAAGHPMALASHWFTM